MLKLVTAGFTSLIPRNAPGEVVYIPVGSHKINATVDGKPGEITINVPKERGQAIAASLQASLEKRLASTVRPRLAFDHAKTGPASAHPKSFSFDPERGIICAVDWSQSGKSAIEGGDYGYFSPTFYPDAEGIPHSLPEKGEIGSLVDEPAFRSIGLIAASENDLQPETTPTYSMKLICAALSISAAADNAEIEAVDRIKAIKVEAAEAKQELATAKAENADLQAKVEAAEAATKDANDKRILAKVEAAVTAGKIAPKDDDTKKELLELLQASEALADKHIAAMPVKFVDFDKAIVKQGGNPQVHAASAFEAKALQLVSAGHAPDLDTAIGMVADTEPALYTDYLANLA